MTRSPLVLRLLGGAALSLALAAGVNAQDAVRKPPPQLPPTGAESNRVPTGVDLGTPATSKALPLGTPVPPNLAADRGELRTRSAAARAAARPGAAASAASAAGGAAAAEAAASPSSDCLAKPPAAARPAPTAPGSIAKVPARPGCL